MTLTETQIANLFISFIIQHESLAFVLSTELMSIIKTTALAYDYGKKRS